MISEWVAAVLLVLGSLFMFIASLGIVRLKDFYMRMHASTKAPSLGIFLMVIGIIVYFFNFRASSEGLIIIIFVFLTTPIGSHMISRVAHSMGVEKDKNTVIDELDGEMNPTQKKSPDSAGEIPEKAKLVRRGSKRV